MAFAERSAARPPPAGMRGYLPIDKFGAECLFQIISHRYERGATLITTNRVYKQWASIFNNDAVLTSA